MSDELGHAKAELRFAELNRRVRLLKIVQGTPVNRRSFLSLSLLRAVVVIVLLYVVIPRILPFPAFNSRSQLLLLAIGCVVVLAMEIATLRKRMDALVTLLKEDGVFQSDPPMAKLLDQQ